MITIFGSLGLGSAVTGLISWLVRRNIEKKAKMKEEQLKQEELNKEQKEKELMNFRCMQMKLISACVILSEATAIAVQRIPDAKCNGDMHKALESAEKLKTELDAFMSQRGMANLFGD